MDIFFIGKINKLYFASAFWKSEASQKDSCACPVMKAKLNTERVGGIRDS